MRRILSILVAVAAVFAMSVTVSAATRATTASCFASVTGDGDCQVTFTATVHIESADGVTFPVPRDATDITLNGTRARTTKTDTARVIDLSKALGHMTGDVSINIHYTLRNVVLSQDDGTLLLQLPILSGASYPIEAMNFTITLPGELPERPSFFSGYHQADIEKEMTVEVNGATVTGNFHTALKDHETLFMQMKVDQQMFPRSATELLRLDFGINAMLVCGVAALLYWLVFLRALPVWRKRCAEPPDGFGAGEMGSILHLRGADLNLMVLSWAQLGYVSLQMDKHEIVTITKRMEMGNERGPTELGCFKKLFAKRESVSTAGAHYAYLVRATAQKATDIQELVHRRSGNLKVFRILVALIGLFGGACLGFSMANGAVLKWLLAIIFAAGGTASAWYLADWASCLFLWRGMRLWTQLLCAGFWLIFGLLAGQFMLALSILGALLLAGLMYAFGGRRTELGRALSCEVLGLRHYLRTVPKTQLQRICNQNPDYFYDLAPYALALGVDRAFASRFAKQRLSACPYLKIQGVEAPSAQLFMRQARQVLQAMDARRRQLFIEKLIAVIRGITK